MVADTEEMVAWLRKDLGKEKIFVLGHSWSSYLGLDLAQHHPEWLHAYIGVAQLVDGPESERRGWHFAADAARLAGNAYLLPEVVSLNLDGVGSLKCPLLLFEGRHDFNLNSEVAAAWFAKVEAPEKHLIWFENSAHLPMTEEPGKFLLSLVRYARPIAESAGDAPKHDDGGS